MSIVEEIDLWLAPRGPQPVEIAVNDDTLEMIPVGGVGDWFKGKLKGILLSYAKPFWTDIKAAIQTRDFAKLADVIDRIGTLAGYAEIAKAISDVFRELAAGNYLAAVEKALAAFRLIASLFPKAEPGGNHIHVSVGTAAAPTDFEAEVDELLDFAFPKPKVGATAVGPDGQPTEFGIIEIAAIGSLIWTAVQAFVAFRKKRKEPAPPVG